MIDLALLMTTQAMVTLAPPIGEARPGTDWSCDFLDGAGQQFTLHGGFAEAPKGTDPNAALPTIIKGNGPAFLMGKQGYNAFESLRDSRRYQVTSRSPEGANYNLSFLFARDNEGLAFITRYIPDAATERGTLSAYATGTCKTNFLPKGAGVPGK